MKELITPYTRFIRNKCNEEHPIFYVFIIQDRIQRQPLVLEMRNRRGDNNLYTKPMPNAEKRKVKRPM